MSVLLAVLFGASAARAADTVPADTRSTAIGLNVGANWTVGLLGVTLTRALGTYFRIEVGGGVGFWGPRCR
jgi:predicted MFS family arabinose efflux permease